MSDTKERPILFSAPMVNAILEGRKTQTRRVIKHQRLSLWRFVDLKDTLGYAASELWRWAGFLLGPDSVSPGYFKCPYGKPGDRLWVRETFASLQAGSYEDIKPDLQCSIIRYKADDPLADLNTDQRGYRYRPSIHMPRWASRINLEIVSIRVERLQDISEGDVRAEGIQVMGYGDYPQEFSGKHLFTALWDSINGKTFPWSDNPWVWVVEFKRVEDTH